VDCGLVTLMDRMLPCSVVEYMEEGRGYAVKGNLDHSAGMITHLLGTPPVPAYRHLRNGYHALRWRLRTRSLTPVDGSRRPRGCGAWIASPAARHWDS